MRLKCEKCKMVVALVKKGAWRERLSPVVVCGKCYDQLSSAYSELNIKDADYAGSKDIGDGYTLDSLKDLFGMKG